MTNSLIIIVDDDPKILDAAKDLLREQYAHVKALRSGRELLEYTEEHIPDMILLDIVMPEMDGFETYRLLREQEKRLGRRNAPVILLSGEHDDVTEQRGLTVGASDYVRKPFDREVLLRRVQNAIYNAKTIESLIEEVTQDSLTGLLNKTGANTKLPVLCRCEAGMLAILDLDNFKLINDLYGHEMGDRALKAFADVLRRNTEEKDILCRFGGDEFLAFFRRRMEKEDARELTKRFNDGLHAECVALMGEDFDIPVGVSAGFVAAPDNGRDYPLLLQLADRALYQVKQGEKHGCAVFEPGVTDAGADDLNAELARVTQIIRERSSSSIPLWPGREGFTWVYRFLARYGTSAVTLLFSLSAADGRESELTEASASFGETLSRVLRRSDAILQLRVNQYFLLLPNLSESNARIAASRVLKAWERSSFHDAVVVNYVTEYQDFEAQKQHGV